MSVLRPGVKGLVVRDCLDRSAGSGLSIKPKRGIGVAALVAAAFAVLTIQADARGGGHFGGGRGGGMGMRGGGGFAVHSFGARSFSGPRMGVRSFSAPRIGARSFGAPRIGRPGVAVRSFQGNRFVGGSRALSGVRPANARFAPGVGNRFAGARSFAGPGTLSRTAFRGGAVFGNRYITNPAWRTAIAPVRFYGRFLGSPWPWWTGGIVIGWIGPVFWPYVYDDFFNYVFWPYVYDDFWPYAYDDVYYGIYGAYAYYNPGQSKPRRGRVQTGGATRPAADVCNTPASDLTDWPIGRIAEIVRPTDLQRTELDALKDANAKAFAMLREACPNDLPSIPTGRLAAMENRLEVMLAAVKTIRPALDGFYQSLSDEQKERFNAVVPTDGNAAAKDQQNFAKLCDGRSPGIMDLPIDRIAQAVNPTEPQRAALDELKTASLKAADTLQTKCPTFRPLTPVGRVEAMEQRLDVTLGAAKTLQPALAKFYDLLNDEQKARFNALRSTGGEQG
jgi:LTXXQ motif family protein